MGRSPVRVAAVQTTAGPDRGHNLDRAAPLVEQAAGEGAGLIVLPEYFSVAGDPSTLRRFAEPLEGPTLHWACELAARLGVRLVAGSFPERRDPMTDPAEPEGNEVGTTGSAASRWLSTPSGSELFNTSCLIGPTGSIEAVYRKIHLFDVTIDGTGVCESATIAPGTSVVVAEPGSWSSTSPEPGAPDESAPPAIGLSLCYDLRFPEIYRIMALRGAKAVAVPSAFTMATGPAHWELLLRARAVENQVFMIAADQVGELPPGMPPCHGHSMIVDPWGTIIAERTEPTPGIVVADLDLDRQRRIREELPVLANRRPDAYLWPDDDRGSLP
jgi:deaminated glutathione amidase